MMRYKKRVWIALVSMASLGALGFFGASLLSSRLVFAAQLNLVVTNTNDSGVGSLRDAITQANAATTTPAAPHQISFNISGGGVQKY